MKQNLKKFIQNLKKFLPIALLLIMVFSILTSFSYYNQNKSANETEQYIIFLQINYSGKVTGGKIMTANETVLSTIKSYIPGLRFDTEAHKLVCIQDICDSMQGQEWVFLLNGNSTDEKIDSYVPKAYDTIGFEYR